MVPQKRHNGTMNVIAISKFRQKLYQLISNLKNEEVVFSYKNKRYRVIEDEEYRTLDTIRVWNKFPKFNLSAKTVKEEAHCGHKY